MPVMSSHVFLCSSFAAHQWCDLLQWCELMNLQFKFSYICVVVACNGAEQWNEEQVFCCDKTLKQQFPQHLHIDVESVSCPCFAVHFVRFLRGTCENHPLTSSGCKKLCVVFTKSFEDAVEGMRSVIKPLQHCLCMKHRKIRGAALCQSMQLWRNKISAGGSVCNVNQDKLLVDVLFEDAASFQHKSTRGSHCSHKKR